MKPRIMYIEKKSNTSDSEQVPVRVGLITFSKTGRTLFYKGKQFQGCIGADANYCDVETGEEYLLSKCKKNDEESHYYESGTVEIDDDVREEYWKKIRNQPERVDDTIA